MDYVYIVTRRATGAFVGVYSDTDSIPDTFFDADEDYAIAQTLVLGTPHSWLLVQRGDVDPSSIRMDRG